MKILYAVQGTGNGHLSRAIDIIPCLQKHGEVDILVSGIQGDLKLPFKVTYEFRGLSRPLENTQEGKFKEVFKEHS